MHVIPFRVVLAASFGSALFAQAPNTNARAVEDVLPASTYAAMRFGGLGACKQAAQGLPMNPVVQNFLQRVPAEVRGEHLDKQLEFAAQHVQSALQHVGIRPADLRTVLGQPMVLAMGRVSIEGMGPSVALLVEEGNAGDALQRVVEAGLQLLPHATAVATDIGGVAVRTVQIEDGPPVFMASIAGHFVATNSRGYLKEVAGVAAGKQPGLARTTALTDLRGRLPAPALAALFVNLQSVMSAFEPHMPYEADDFAQALGMGRLDSMYAATTASAHGGSDVLHVGMRGSAHGLMKALVAAPADLAFARACSPNTVMFAAGSLDAPAVVDAFHRFALLLPEQVRTEMLDGMAAEFGVALEEIGSSPQQMDTILRAFGNQVGIALALEKGPVPKPELLVRFAVRDGKVVTPLLQKLEAVVTEAQSAFAQEVDAPKLHWQTRKVGEHELRFCSIPVADGKLQLSPCYVLTADALWFASDTAALVRALRQGDNAEQSLFAQPDFTTMATLADGASGVMHLRLFRAAELGWRSLETLVYPQLDAHKDEVGFGSEALPDTEAMVAALGTSTFFYRVDDAGLTVENHGTFSLGAVLAAFGSLGDEVLSLSAGKTH